MKTYPTIKGENDLEPVPAHICRLGSIPLAAKRELKSEYLVVREKDNRKDKHNKEFRRVCTKMINLCDVMNLKVIMFTSFGQESGKTFTALNLAKSMALVHKKRVVMLDTDLHTAKLSKMISDPPVGLISYLNKSIYNEKILLYNCFSNGSKGFDVIPAGKVPVSNPSDFLTQKEDRLKELIAWLKCKYDYVFLNSMPVNCLAEADIADNYAGLAVFVLRENHTDRRRLGDLEKICQMKQYKKMALILNGSKMKKTGAADISKIFILVLSVFLGMLIGFLMVV